MKEETRTEESTEELSRETNTSSLSLSKKQSLAFSHGAPPLSSGQKKNCSSFFLIKTDSGGSSQQTLVEVRNVFTHASTKHALKKTAFFARGAVFCVAILIQTSSYVFRSDDDERAEKTDWGERCVEFDRE